MYRRVKYACYTGNMSMSVVSTLSPLLFLTFRKMYGFSYSMLGALVLVNYLTQLTVDLVLSFNTQRFQAEKVVKLMPKMTVMGLLIYALFPMVFPAWTYGGILLGTVIFSASAGIAEVMVSPVIAALPSENPDREMSKLHSMYAWGVVGVVLGSTLFLQVFGQGSWPFLTLLWAMVPLSSCILFTKAQLPSLEKPKQGAKAGKLLFNKQFLLYMLCIFLGGASECTMAQWCSGYLEMATGLPKVWGDLLGVAMFSVMLGTGRSLYAKRGKNIHRTLWLGALGAVVCYLVASTVSQPMIGLVACVMTGLCTSMLWPGSLMVSSEHFSSFGVAMFGLMAAGGDLGGSVGPQIVGFITDAVLDHPLALSLAQSRGLSLEQLGMKVGMLTATVFPLLAAVLFGLLYWRNQKAGSAPAARVGE